MTLTESISKAIQDATKSLKSTGKKVDAKYKRETKGGTKPVSGNSSFHSDAREVARMAEKLKDQALRDVDRRF
jgi:hypothetical protein